jgi:hypothetical protein
MPLTKGGSDMGDKLERDQLYAAAVSLIGTDTQVFWSVNQTFLLAETLLATLLTPERVGDALRVSGAVLGVVVGLLWIMAASRLAGFAGIRADYARELESMTAEGPLTRGDVFREKGEVMVGGRQVKANPMGRVPVRWVGVTLACAFLVYFIVATLISLF